MSFFEDLRCGEPISILIDPAFKANYPEEYESIPGGLRALGVRHMISVSFGADVSTWAKGTPARRDAGGSDPVQDIYEREGK